MIYRVSSIHYRVSSIEYPCAWLPYRYITVILFCEIRRAHWFGIFWKEKSLVLTKTDCGFSTSGAIRGVSIEQNVIEPRRHYAFVPVRWNLQMRRTFHVLSIAPKFSPYLRTGWGMPAFFNSGVLACYKHQRCMFSANFALR